MLPVADIMDLVSKYGNVPLKAGVSRFLLKTVIDALGVNTSEKDVELLFGRLEELWNSNGGKAVSVKEAAEDPVIRQILERAAEPRLAFVRCPACDQVREIDVLQPPTCSCGLPLG